MLGQTPQKNWYTDFSCILKSNHDNCKAEKSNDGKHRHQCKVKKSNDGKHGKVAASTASKAA